MTDSKNSDIGAADQNQDIEKAPRKAEKKISLSNGALELLATLADEGYLFWFRDRMMWGNSISYVFLDPKTAVARAEVPFSIIRTLIHRVIDLNLIERLSGKRIAALEASLDGHALEKLRRREKGTLYAVTDEGRRVLEALRPQLLRIQEERAVPIDQGRLVAMANCGWRGEHKPGVSALCKVIRETAQRLYVVPVINSYEGSFGKTERLPTEFHPLIRGNQKLKYVERSDVVAKVSSVEHYRQMLNATWAFHESLKNANAQMQEEIAPIQQRFEQRRAQLLAQLEDECRPQEQDSSPSEPKPGQGR
jgi:hypothetical protein